MSMLMQDTAFKIFRIILIPSLTIGNEGAIMISERVRID